MNMQDDEFPSDSSRLRRNRAVSLSYDWDNVVTLSEEKKVRKVSRSMEDVLVQHTYKHQGYIQFERSAFHFSTGSTYTGKWNSIGMEGNGDFQFPHKVEYEGNLRDGMFHGQGKLTYPMGQKLEGEWVKGKLVSFKFRFEDSLDYDAPWKYCKMPDRKFFTCMQNNLRPAGRSLLTNIDPPREIPKGCYDTGDGFYNPATKCVWSAIKPNKILRHQTNLTNMQGVLEISVQNSSGLPTYQRQ
ncbi:hypothetical protein ILUMI_21042 [Ignelater luminosus]|uniref:MORN repeat-containing protein 5 n=1 Tax=Ignelater luminosus TaxID=2038154 RepID=A0A8K0CIH4_IGNLU|nr:hypothetical protein ILUMI_21042 [Ignelater luminosus]